jgi:peptidase E
LDVALSEPPTSELVAAIDEADAIIFSGGNTLFAVDRCPPFQPP